MPQDSSSLTNRLCDESSPYLRQHQGNPVAWQAWSPETLALAKKENKPILLSVGYAACHWCHVMAHECFENDEIAALMNRHFINIKVDREERPDLDSIYQSALALLRQPGGWPLTMFLTPAGGSSRSRGAARTSRGVASGARHACVTRCAWHSCGGRRRASASWPT